MLKEFKLVKGAIGKKNLEPILKHFRIKSGWIIGTNGRLSLSVQCPSLSELDITVPADPLIKAIEKCTTEPIFKVTPGGRLSIKSGKLRILIPLHDNEAFPMPQMTGTPTYLPELIPALKRIHKYIGDDASRPWCCGALLYDNALYATNNTALVRVPIEYSGIPVNLPSFLIDELIRINEEPLEVRITENKLVAYLKEGLWLTSVLLSTQWPNAAALLNSILDHDLPPVPSELKTHVETVLPFCSDPRFPKIFFTENGITTEEGNQQAFVEVSGLAAACFRAEPLLMTLSDATHADFAQWPNACPWYGENDLEGALIGIRL